MSDKNFKIRFKNGNNEFEIEGDKEFIDNYYIKIKEDFLIEKKQIEKKLILDKINKEEKKEIHEISKTLTEFYKSKSPRNHNETIITFAYWLLNNQNIEEFQTTKNILECYETIKIKKPGNIHQHISNLNKEGLIMPGNKDGNYKLTLYGIEFVEKQLPKKK